MSKQELQISTENSNVSIFSSIKSFEDGQRIATALSKSDLVPAAYKNNVLNTMIALETANRLHISPFMVMQNLCVVKGKPSWSSTFIISAINSCGRFKPLRFKFEGSDSTSDDFGCRAVTIDIETGEKIIGPKVDWRMVKAEGWLQESGSKWKTMPELMFQYRAAAFFGRLYAPDILKGMKSIEENIDITSINDNIHDQQLIQIQELLKHEGLDLDEKEIEYIDQIVDEKIIKSYQKVINHLKSKINEQL
jgi:hypothetical protein